MRFLVVDDDPQKLQLVRTFLVEQGVDTNDILQAEHAAGARIALASGSVDILLIDVLLPARRGAPALGQNCVELLRQIMEDGTTPAPRHILGMTASADTRAEFEADFQSLITRVLHIAPGEHRWRQDLGGFLLFLRHITSAREANDYDICVLNALRAPELSGLLAAWQPRLGAEQLLGRNIIYQTGLVTLEGVERRLVCAHLAQMGPIASTHAATALLSEFRPRIILMTGICGGFADHVNIGDIVVAEKSWDWQAGKWKDGGAAPAESQALESPIDATNRSFNARLESALDQRDASPELIADARALSERIAAIHETYQGIKPGSAPKLVVGPMVTGSSVVASMDIQTLFREQHRKMVGIDMECYGLYYAAALHGGSPVKAICIKSVSDLADRAKGDDFQTYCSHMSAMVGLETLKGFFRG
ncbi:hypothetical protein ACILG0_08945 [Pseudomonadota bacterium AL_CKDN230030165-1A_HGKHYDSX7]